MSISVLYTRVSTVDQKTVRQRVKEDDSNKKRTSKNTSPSCLVARAGLEPATFGL